MNKVFDQMLLDMEQRLKARSSSLDPAAMDDLKTEVRNAMEKEVIPEMTALMETAPTAYAKSMTVEEMRAVQAFYSTAAGAKILEKGLRADLTKEEIRPVFAFISTPAGEKGMKTITEVNSRMMDVMMGVVRAEDGVLKKHGLDPKEQ
jgi:hypothetical protein